MGKLLAVLFNDKLPRNHLYYALLDTIFKPDCELQYRLATNFDTAESDQIETTRFRRETRCEGQ